MKHTVMSKLRLTAAVLLTFLTVTLAAESEEVKKGTSIAAKMIYRKDGFSSYSYAILASCSFTQSGDSFKCSSTPRKKVFESIQKDTGADGDDSISVSLLLEPASEKGTAFLQKDYDDKSLDSEQWLFLPALKRLKRVVSQSKNTPKTGTLFGSEIAYEDIEKVRLQDYTFHYKGDETVAGRTAFKIESFPTNRRKAKTSYGRSVMWVDKATYIPLKTKLYDRTGKLSKTMLNQSLKKQKGIWYFERTIVVSHKRNRMSMILNKTTNLNRQIPDSLFKPRALGDKSYRESKMAGIR